MATGYEKSRDKADMDRPVAATAKKIPYVYVLGVAKYIISLRIDFKESLALEFNGFKKIAPRQ